MIGPASEEDGISLLFDLFILIFGPCERRGGIVCEDATNTALAEEEDTNGVIVRDPESERDRDLCGEERDPVIVYGFIHHRRFVDYDAGIPRPDFPAPVNGLKKPGERGYQFATLTIIGTNAPIILAVEPVKANSYWEDNDATNTPRAEIVDRLVTEAEQYVDIHMVMADREFDGHQVRHTLDDHDVTYLIPKKKYTDDLEGVSKVGEHPISDVGVEPDVELWLDGELSHEVNLMYVPSRNEDGKDTVFLTNREGVEPEDVRGLCARYDRRWEIENEYKQIKKFLPTHASTDYRVRAFSFVFGCLLYNVWRLTDYLLKLELGIPIRDKPLLTAGETIELLACILVPDG